MQISLFLKQDVVNQAFIQVKNQKHWSEVPMKEEKTLFGEGC